MTDQELIDANMPPDGEYIEFVGMNCNDWMIDANDTECPGWDGRSNRCRCGNRRVYWSIEGTGSNRYVVAMAD